MLGRAVCRRLVSSQLGSDVLDSKSSFVKSYFLKRKPWLVMVKKYLRLYTVHQEMTYFKL